MALSAHLTRRAFVAASASAAALGGVAARAAGAPLDVNIVNTDGSGERVMEALVQRQHYFEELGLKPKIDFVFGNQKILDALLGGRSDVCMGSGVSNVITQIAAGAPLRLLAGANQRVVQAIFSAKPDIRTMKDLEGKRVGSGPKGQLVHELTAAAMIKAGADPAKVEFVNLGNSGTIFEAVVKGEIDAGTGEEYVFDNQAKYGVHALKGGVLWDELPDYINQASYASLDAIKTKKDALARTLAAHAKAYRFLQTPASKAAYAAARAEAMGQVDASETKTQWDFYQRFKPYATGLLLTEKQVRSIQQVNMALGFQKTILPYEAVVDSSVAKAALGLLKG